MKLRNSAVPALVTAIALMAGSLAHGASAASRIVIEARYFADSVIGDRGLVRGKFPLERAIHPFRPLVRRLMENEDASLLIQAEGLALGSLYDFMENRVRLRHLRFTGATIEGRVSLTSKQAGLTCAARFAGAMAPRNAGLIVGVWDYRESPQFAPFEAALAEPGSFTTALAAVIGALALVREE